MDGITSLCIREEDGILPDAVYKVSQVFIKSVKSPLYHKQRICELQEVTTDGSPGGHKVVIKAKVGGSINKILIKKDDVVQIGTDLLHLEMCRHSTMLGNTCANCGITLEEDDDNEEISPNNSAPLSATKEDLASVSMLHSMPQVKVTLQLAQNIGEEDRKHLLQNKKLVLLVDLDQTLVHTTNIRVPKNMKDVHHFKLHPHGQWYHTKLRPHTGPFLQAMDKLYELHICTYGTRDYAEYIAKLIDPHGKLFNQRILSRNEFLNPNSKTNNLKSLFPCGEELVCIIDDRSDVWGHSPSVLQVVPYNFFENTGDINAPPHLVRQQLPPSKKKGSSESSSNSSTSSIRSSNKDKGKREENCNKTGSINTNESTKNSSVSEKCDKLSDFEGLDITDSTNNKTDKISSSEKTITDKTVSSEKQETNKTVSSEKQETNKTVSSEKQETDKTVSSEKQETNKTVSSEKQESNKTVSSEKQETDKTVSNTVGNGDPVNDDAKDNSEEKDLTKSDEIGVVEKSDELSAAGGDVKSTEKNSENCDENVIKDDSQDSHPDKEDGELERDKSSETDVIEQEKQTRPDDSEIVDVPDNDDYLLSLTLMLEKVHSEFYKRFQPPSDEDEGFLPDVKVLVPEVRRRTLAGCHIVMSGMVPHGTSYKNTRAFSIAESLGARVSSELPSPDDDVKISHMVAADPHTAKVRQAQSIPGIKIVTPDWLWECMEKWKRVDEACHPLTAESTRTLRRTPPEHCCLPYHSQPTGSTDIQNLFFLFQDRDKDRMLQEVDELLDSDEDPASDELNSDSKQNMEKMMFGSSVSSADSSETTPNESTAKRKRRLSAGQRGVRRKTWDDESDENESEKEVKRRKRKEKGEESDGKSAEWLDESSDSVMEDLDSAEEATIRQLEQDFLQD